MGPAVSELTRAPTCFDSSPLHQNPFTLGVSGETALETLVILETVAGPEPRKAVQVWGCDGHPAAKSSPCLPRSKGGCVFPWPEGAGPRDFTAGRLLQLQGTEGSLLPLNKEENEIPIFIFFQGPDGGSEVPHGSRSLKPLSLELLNLPGFRSSRGLNYVVRPSGPKQTCFIHLKNRLL